MSTTLRTTGASMDKVSSGDDSQNVFGASLKDAGGPSINVLTKLVCIIAIINQLSWALFFLVMSVVVLVGSVFLFNYFKGGQASFDPSLMNQELTQNLSSLKAKAHELVPFSFGVEDEYHPAASVSSLDVEVEHSSSNSSSQPSSSSSSAKVTVSPASQSS
jgi:hypothetical protein